MFEVQQVRADFPILSQEVFGHPLVYLDNAATMQMPEPVLQTVVNHYHADNANVHRGIHALSERSTRALETARERVRAFVNAKSADEIVFTSGTTGSLNMLADMWFGSGCADGAVVTTMMEHHANFVPWQQACLKHGCDFLVAPLDEKGDLDMGELMASLGVQEAVNLDGGDSTYMVFMGEVINTPSSVDNNKDGSLDRKLFDMLLFAEYDADGNAPALTDVDTSKIQVKANEE